MGLPPKAFLEQTTMEETMEDFRDIDSLILVYQDENGKLFEQPANDLPYAGLLIDDNGEDMELIGYRAER